MNPGLPDRLWALYGLVLYSHLQHHNDTIIKTQEDFFIKIYTSPFIVRVRKGLHKVCLWEGARDRTELQHFDPHIMAVSVVSFSFSRAAQPEARRPSLLGDGFLYCILSATSLDPNSSGFPRAPSAGCGFPYHISSITPSLSNWNSLDICLDWVI